MDSEQFKHSCKMMFPHHKTFVNYKQVHAAADLVFKAWKILMKFHSKSIRCNQSHTPGFSPSKKKKDNYASLSKKRNTNCIILNPNTFHSKNYYSILTLVSSFKISVSNSGSSSSSSIFINFVTIYQFDIGYSFHISANFIWFYMMQMHIPFNRNNRDLANL